MSKNIWVVVLIVIIIAAVVIGVVLMKPKAGEAKEKVARQKIKVIDPKTLETVTVVRGDYVKWQVDKATGYRIEPETGRLLARRMKCMSCGKWIPDAPIPRRAGIDEDEARAKYICPLCKKPAYAPGL